MDFNDSPQEAAFRKEVFDWLGANAELRKETDDSAFSLCSENESDEFVAASKAWQLKKPERVGPVSPDQKPTMAVAVR